jgi:DNA-binding NarL/FixJ family response regulator
MVNVVGESMNFTTRSNPTGKIKVLVVDDLAHVRQGLHTALELMDDIKVVGEASDGLEAVRLAERLKPDVVVMDLEMPRMDGFDATQRIKERNLAQRVIILTIHGQDDARERAARVGADDFVEKEEGFQTLVDAIRQVWSQTTAKGRNNESTF